MPIEYEVERDIVEYLGAHYSIEPDEITDESTLDDLGLDSLGVLAIAASSRRSTARRRANCGVRTLSDFKDLVVLKIADLALHGPRGLVDNPIIGATQHECIHGDRRFSPGLPGSPNGRMKTTSERRDVRPPI